LIGADDRILTRPLAVKVFSKIKQPLRGGVTMKLPGKRLRRGLLVLGAGALLAGMITSNASAVTGLFFTTNVLVSNLPIVPTPDPNLLNAWGVAFLPGSPFWVNANNNGTSNLYTGTGAIFTELPRVTIPPPAATPTAIAGPTGIVGNPNNVLAMGTDFTGDVFIFDSEDGIISGWQPKDGGVAKIQVDNSSLDNPMNPAKNAVYKGLAIASFKGANYIYAANFRQNKVEVYDIDYNLVTLAGNFSDPFIPAGYAPFNIAPINGNLFVTYAQQDAAKHDDVPGLGKGFVDVFTTGGIFVKRFASRGLLNAPWGVTIVPPNNGVLSGMLLVGNFGDGHINIFQPTFGIPLGQVLTRHGAIVKPLVIDGLWSLLNGTGADDAATNSLYYSSGPDHENDGEFGTITVEK
jgi:uncharacterized protein (TIGR03118 family)